MLNRLTSEEIQKEIDRITERLLKNNRRRDGEHCSELDRTRHQQIAEDTNLLEDFNLELELRKLATKNTPP